MLSLRGLEQAAAISSLCFVILSETKDLKAYTIIHRLVVLEILHSVQNDSTWRHIIQCHAERKRSISRFALPPTVSEILRFFTSFRMTAHGVILYNVMLSNAKHPLEADQRQR